MQLGAPEIIVIALVGFLIFGHRLVPRLVKTLSEARRELKNQSGS